MSTNAKKKKEEALRKLGCKTSCVLKDMRMYQLIVCYCAKGCAPRLMENHPSVPGRLLGTFSLPGVSPKPRHSPGAGTATS